MKYADSLHFIHFYPVALLDVNERFGNGKKKETPEVIQAQQYVADALPHCECVNTRKAAIANGAHWNVQGTLDAGRWFAEALLKMESEIEGWEKSYRLDPSALPIGD